MVLLARIADAPECMSLADVGAYADLSEMQSWQIMAMNDGRDYEYCGEFLSAVRADRKHTFSEIADVIESWSKRTR